MTDGHDRRPETSGYAVSKAGYELDFVDAFDDDEFAAEDLDILPCDRQTPASSYSGPMEFTIDYFRSYRPAPSG